MNTTLLPSTDEMYRALVNRDSSYEGTFVVGVRTTGIFCRPTCSARKPKRENVDFYPSPGEALSAGFRPCLRCRPLDAAGTAPRWATRAVELVESDPSRRWSDSDLRDHDIDPVRVRRWFKQHHGITFHTYQRTRRLSSAMGEIRNGKSITHAAIDNGYDSLSGFRDAFNKWFGDLPRDAAGKQSLVVVNRILTPLGPMVAAASDEHGLHILEFADRQMLSTQIRRVAQRRNAAFVLDSHPTISQTEQQLGEYFDGLRHQFDLPLDLIGTEFQSSVWNRLRKIGYGETLSYERLAREIGHRGAQRAVGRANGDNRIAIVVPCHRVIRSDGTLSGYGGGLWRKQWLLDHERGDRSAG